jgi:hypothetical protein
VNAAAVQVETTNTQLGDVVETKKMLALPLNGRSYIDLLGLQAGVAPATSGPSHRIVRYPGNLTRETFPSMGRVSRPTRSW